MNTLWYRLRMWGWLCESWKREVGKDSMIECSPVGCSQASAHRSTLCVPIYCAGQVRRRLLIVCGAPRPLVWQGNNSSFFQRKEHISELAAFKFAWISPPPPLGDPRFRVRAFEFALAWKWDPVVQNTNLPSSGHENVAFCVLFHAVGARS